MRSLDTETQFRRRSFSQLSPWGMGLRSDKVQAASCTEVLNESSFFFQFFKENKNEFFVAQ